MNARSRPYADVMSLEMKKKTWGAQPFQKFRNGAKILIEKGAEKDVRGNTRPITQKIENQKGKEVHGDIPRKHAKPKKLVAFHK